MKDWLTIIILVLIIGIVLDGVRRMRAARRESIKFSRNAKKADFDGEVRVSSSEFPSGGARVAARRDAKDVSSLNETVRKKFESQKVTKGAPNRIPEQVSLKLDEAVPMLMDSVEEDEEAKLHDTEQDVEEQEKQREPQLGDYEDLDEAEAYPEETAQEEEHTPDTELDDFEAEPEREEDAIDSVAQAAQTETAERSFAEMEEPEDEEPEVDEEAVDDERDDDDWEDGQDEEEASYHEPDEVLIFNVMAHQGERFAGSDLLKALMAENLKFGNMDIFHRHADSDGDGPILYSLANMVVPGTFNLAEMNDFSTPGVTLFLSLPVEGDSLAAYNDLAQTAKNLAQNLDGELKDENRSVMTSQTIEHGRQRVIEYERKRKLARA